ncbi:ABC transporter substrate-binding protein [Rouxiella silvae]|uniref:ABC transporter substrate-binding protein n=2 Tax=Rouxiella silvae TaxID=1646373 RepID=A0ABX3TWK2_9GAMM|nr:extracellular solute-binding protein [Rouxiella silvae]KQN47354.1 ABC transporter substrate-binding protein [Serratia sp. Leaf50]ORJ19570.1 ABC transporter substrate-binding protein [Rouxiella silvae]
MRDVKNRVLHKKIHNISAGLLLGALVMGSAAAANAADNINVTYAGSMGVVMDKYLGPTFAKQHNVNYQGQGQGAYGMANLLASKKVVADVFVSITPGPIDVLKKAGLVDTSVPVASTSMVIAYNPKGKFAQQFAAIKDHKAGAEPWWKVLQSPGLHFGRTDPATDPQGQNIIFTMMLAEKYYHQPGLTKSVLGETTNPAQVLAEGGLLTRLEAGQVDAASGYESATRSAKLPYIVLPDEINLSNPDMSAKWYDTVSFTIKDNAGKDKTLHTQPLVFYAAVLKNAPNPQAAKEFVAFMKSAEGQKLFQQNGYDKPKGHDY